MFRVILLLTTAVVFATVMAHHLHSDGERNALTEQKGDADFILPKKSVPSHYKLKLIPYLLDGNLTFVGETNITCNVLELTDNIVLHAKNLNINESMTILKNNSGKVIKPNAHKYDNVTDFLTLTFEDPLTPGTYELHFKFTAELRDDSEGFYSLSYENENNSTVWIAATHFQPSHARTAFPCWDEPALKARFDILIKHYPNYTVLSNMPVRSQLAVEDDGMRWTIFETTPIMSTNILAFVLHDFDHVSNPSGTVRVWGRKAAMPYINYVLDISENVTNTMEHYTNISVGVPKMDHVALPTYLMRILECWGLVLYGEPNIEHHPILKPRKKNVLNVIHEISHMWFGNLVTPSSWIYAWMSEGFATYFSYFVENKLFPDWRVLDTYGAMKITEFFQRDRTPCVPLNQNVINCPDNQMQFFSWIAYKKASAIIDMTAHSLSEKVFQKGIQKYLRQHSYSSVTPDDLSDALQWALNESGRPYDQFNVTEFLHIWENRAGYPLVNVIRNYTTGEIRLTQEIFASCPRNERNYNSSARWWIPVSYATRSNPDFSQTLPKIWMQPQDNVTRIEGVNNDDWIILNVQVTGVYRVKYDDTNWQWIAVYLNSDNYTDIHVINRVHLINDAYELLSTSDINPVTFFQLLSYLERENDTIPWRSAVNIIERMYTYIMTPERKPIFHKRIVRLINNTVNRVGWEAVPNEDRGLKSIRADILHIACLYGYTECSISQDAVVKYIDDLQNSEGLERISNQYLCPALREAGDTAWQKIFNLYTADPDVYKLLYLSCTNNVTLFENVLALMVAENSPIIRPFFMVYLHMYLELNPVHVDIALNYFIKNKETFRDLITVDFFTERTYTNDQFQKMLDNFPPNTPEDQKILAREQAKIITWENAFSKIHKWLESQENVTKINE